MVPNALYSIFPLVVNFKKSFVNYTTIDSWNIERMCNRSGMAALSSKTENEAIE